MVIDKLVERCSDHLAGFEAKAVTALSEAFAEARPGQSGDATEALDAVSHQATWVDEPDSPAGVEQLCDRLNAVRVLVDDYSDADLKTCSDTVQSLYELSEDGHLNQKLAVLSELKGKFPADTDLDVVMGTLSQLVEDVAFMTDDEWNLHDPGEDGPGWDRLVEAVRDAPAITDEADRDELIGQATVNLLQAMPSDDDSGDQGDTDGGDADDNDTDSGDNGNDTGDDGDDDGNGGGDDTDAGDGGDSGSEGA